MTWTDLINSVSQRLNRDDLSYEFVNDMLTQQITMYGPQIFAPSEQTVIVNTQAGQYFVPLPAGFQRLTYCRVLYNGVWIPVDIIPSYTDILAVDPLQPPFVSLPVSWCRVYGTNLRLFPTPDNVYPVELTIFGTVLGPVDDNDTTNFWLNDGNIFLRAATCLAICVEYLDSTISNSPRIATWTKRTDNALSQLQTQAHIWSGPSSVKQHL